MPKRCVVGNWKLHKTCAEARELIAELVAHQALHDPRIRCVVAPPATALDAARQAIGQHPLALCAQHINATDSGALTGEISGPLAAEAGASYVLVGHSERRSIFHESDADVAAQVQSALRAGLTPIVCVGETAHQRQQRRSTQVVQRQLRAACAAHLSSFRDGDQSPHLMVAYEPIWAIGTGHAADPEQAQEVHATLRSTLQEMVGTWAGEVTLLYGGSVTAAHAAAFAAQRDIDGVLVGGASLKAASFLDIVRAVTDA